MKGRVRKTKVNPRNIPSVESKRLRVSNGCKLAMAFGFIFAVGVATAIIVLLLLLYKRNDNSTGTSTTATQTTSFAPVWNPIGTTVAGVTNMTGTSSLLLDHPICLALDSSNTLYVTDGWNHRVQKYSSGATSGTTVAGQSNGTSGSTLYYLSYPNDLAIDSSGNVYVVDGSNSRVLFWSVGSPSGVVVAGIGGSGSANNQFSSPFGLALDSSSGTIYVSDAMNHRVMRYLSGASSGTVVAGGNGSGTGSTQLNYPRGLYFESSTNSLLIANNRAHNIVRWVIGASTWTLVVGSSTGGFGSTPTTLSYPTDVTLDSLGNLYVSDEGNQRIQFFSAGQSNGTTIFGVTNVQGSNATLFNTPSSVIVDSQFNVYVADYGNARVQKFSH